MSHTLKTYRSLRTAGGRQHPTYLNRDAARVGAQFYAAADGAPVVLQQFRQTGTMQWGWVDLEVVNP